MLTSRWRWWWWWWWWEREGGRERATGTKSRHNTECINSRNWLYEPLDLHFQQWMRTFPLETMVACRWMHAMARSSMYTHATLWLFRWYVWMMESVVGHMCTGTSRREALAGGRHYPAGSTSRRVALTGRIITFAEPKVDRCSLQLSDWFENTK